MRVRSGNGREPASMRTWLCGRRLPLRWWDSSVVFHLRQKQERGGLRRFWIMFVGHLVSPAWYLGSTPFSTQICAALQGYLRTWKSMFQKLLVEHPSEWKPWSCLHLLLFCSLFNKTTVFLPPQRFSAAFPPLVLIFKVLRGFPITVSLPFMWCFLVPHFTVSP